MIAARVRALACGVNLTRWTDPLSARVSTALHSLQAAGLADVTWEACRDLVDEAEFVQLSLPYALLTGKTRDGVSPVHQFQSGAVPLFLISLKAGGAELNLTAADTVIHYDPWWNHAFENQATDRLHRIDQDKPVFVHRLITAETVEKRMQMLKGRKQALADGIFGADNGIILALIKADLEMLLG